MDISYLLSSSLLANALELALVVVLVPELLRYLEEKSIYRRKIDLNTDVINPCENPLPVYGLVPQLEKIAPSIDRTRNPQAYHGLSAGNEVIIVGSEQAGKQALAMEIARKAGMDRVIVVYEPGDTDVLAYAKAMIDPPQHWWRRAARQLTLRRQSPKTMLLLLGLHAIDDERRQTCLAQLDALIESARKLPHAMIVGTTQVYDSEKTPWFGTVLALPADGSDEWKDMIRQVAGGYLDATLADGYRLSGFGMDSLWRRIEQAYASDSVDRRELVETVQAEHRSADFGKEDFIDRLLSVDPKPSDIEDIINKCREMAIYYQCRQMVGAGALPRVLAITPEILEASIPLVIPKPMARKRVASPCPLGLSPTG